jgi:hypothetical protein
VDPLAHSPGSGCPPSWIPTFGELPGTDRSVHALAVYDDGGGPALYAGGNFESAGSVLANRIARWDGSSWTALRSGTNGVVRALAVHDDGGGPALYAGGGFGSAGGVPANGIARWDGSSWTALGSGTSDDVHALAVYDDGGGPALYAGGAFTLAGGVTVNRIAKWDGSTWTALGGGMGPGLVHALAVYDDGGGPALHAAGAFTLAGGVTVNRIAKWDGSTWTALGSGMDQPVFALVAFDGGSGPGLYAAGNFTLASGGAANRIARWDGSTWTALGSGMNEVVRGLATYDDGSGPVLYSGGFFTGAGAAAADNIARWDGSSWSALGSRLGLNEVVFALAVHDDGGGPALHAGGTFTSAGGVTVNRIAKWDGSIWSPLGSGVTGVVHALAVYDDGGGPALHAGGTFTSAGGVEASRIARWDGSTWSALGGGMNGAVGVLTAYDDGSGSALYAGGSFSSAGGLPASGIAKWDGSTWSALGTGTTHGVAALAVHDDGSGPALFVGGAFTHAGGVVASGIAKWDGASWAALGSGLGGTTPHVYALAVYDDGGGPALYAGGWFTSAGGIPLKGIARWDGSSWSALGGGVGGSIPHVVALAVHDDGRGPALYAGGTFTSAGGEAANRIARWDGSGWSALGSGVGGGTSPVVSALIVHDDGGGPALFAGGSFTSGLDSGDSYLAKWGAPDSIPPVLSCPLQIRAPDRLFDGQEAVFFTVTATDDLDPAPVVACVPPSGSTFPLGTTLVDCTVTDACGNESTCQFPVTVSLKARPR